MATDKSERKRKKSESKDEDTKKKRKSVDSEPASAVKKKKKKSVDGVTPKKTKDVAEVKSVKEVDVDPSLLSPIAVPLAHAKLVTGIFEVVKKAAKGKFLRRGIREVAKAIRKGQKGFCVLAGDVYPIDVIAHLPLACEEASIPYCYVPHKDSLGNAALTKRPTSVLLITDASESSDFSDEFKTCKKEVKKLQQVVY